MIDGGNRAIFKLSNPGELGLYTNNRLSMFFSEANDARREVGGGTKV